MAGKLSWTPLFAQLASCGDEVLFLISPFIQRVALAKLLDEFDSLETLQVITRWNRLDILSGVSDIEIFPDLESLGIPLYINPDIHLKLAIFENDNAFHSSGNVTQRGLGIVENPNVEIGCEVKLMGEDWCQIHSVLSSSLRVDEEVYFQAKEYIAENKEAAPPLPELTYSSKAGDKDFSRHSLPFTEHPDLLWKYYANDQYNGSRADYVHDLVLYRLQTKGKSREEFMNELKLQFKNNPFVAAVALFVEAKKDLRFGSINNWITEKCSDKPVPFKWEMKPTTRYLYDWLAYFYDEINWDQPNHSQIIRWRSG